VIVAEVSLDVKATYQPQLNEEHTEWGWFKLADIMAGNANALQGELHPVISKFFQQHPNSVYVAA
jgi:hypothetical protein